MDDRIIKPKGKTTVSMSTDSGLKRYQSMDLLIWTILLFVFETIVVKAGTVWFKSQPWTLSLVPALTTIVYIRWGLYGAFYSALGGVAICFASKAGAVQYAVYVLGNLFSVFSLPFWLQKYKIIILLPRLVFF